MINKQSLFVVSIMLLTSACSTDTRTNCSLTDTVQVEAQEDRNINFFETNNNFDLSPEVIKQIHALLSVTKSKEIDNLSFMLVSNKPVSTDKYKSVKAQIYSLMYQYGFMNSRIVDAGTCVYNEAKRGIRIDVLQYNVKEPDCSPWSEYIGDIDLNKSLPKYGTAATYNLEHMIANKADLIAPRTYTGQSAKDAIVAVKTMGATSNSSGGGANGSSGTSGSSSSSSASGSSSTSSTANLASSISSLAAGAAV